MTYDRDYVAALPFLKSYGIWSDMAMVWWSGNLNLRAGNGAYGVDRDWRLLKFTFAVHNDI